jgi:hypothetical protein
VATPIHVRADRVVGTIPFRRRNPKRDRPTTDGGARAKIAETRSDEMELRIGPLAAAAWFLAAALPGVGLTSAQTEEAAEAAPPPRMEVEQETVDLGDVIRGEAVVASFVVRNVGGETLRILKAKPG